MANTLAAPLCAQYTSMLMNIAFLCPTPTHMRLKTTCSSKLFVAFLRIQVSKHTIMSIATDTHWRNSEWQCVCICEHHCSPGSFVQRNMYKKYMPRHIHTGQIGVYLITKSLCKLYFPRFATVFPASLQTCMVITVAMVSWAAGKMLAKLTYKHMFPIYRSGPGGNGNTVWN